MESNSVLRITYLIIGYIFVIFTGSPIVSVVCRKFRPNDMDQIGKGAGRYIGYF
ncbi:MAG: hypothetical protein QMD71_05075 [bacterium]|nr:hypothetical protein [bacterium]